MKDLTEKIRVRIMQEAYDLADRNDSEGYNSVKVMCSDVLTLLPRREWVGLTRDEVLDIEETAKHPLDFARSVEAKLREKNT